MKKIIILCLCISSLLAAETIELFGEKYQVKANLLHITFENQSLGKDMKLDKSLMNKLKSYPWCKKVSRTQDGILLTLREDKKANAKTIHSVYALLTDAHKKHPELRICLVYEYLPKPDEKSFLLILNGNIWFEASDIQDYIMHKLGKEKLTTDELRAELKHLAATYNFVNAYRGRFNLSHGYYVFRMSQEDCLAPDKLLNNLAQTLSYPDQTDDEGERLSVETILWESKPNPS